MGGARGDRAPRWLPRMQRAMQLVAAATEVHGRQRHGILGAMTRRTKRLGFVLGLRWDPAFASVALDLASNGNVARLDGATLTNLGRGHPRSTDEFRRPRRSFSPQCCTAIYNPSTSAASWVRCIGSRRPSSVANSVASARACSEYALVKRSYIASIAESAAFVAAR